ncbi:gustatory receptor for sugar taste 64a isoform X2 [Stomoxys calcitrans]|uniref:gustatory receptor for sugar taste 64a isoform X2 n=1 Tax=Stomoxys calcitrans TaxID=35570 RepID=UPI0027E32C3B|nr:gustatory receptor for sugar taste 64a isoform X2 [Stomoxys calcitrans]
MNQSQCIDRFSKKPSKGTPLNNLMRKPNGNKFLISHTDGDGLQRSPEENSNDYVHETSNVDEANNQGWLEDDHQFEREEKSKTPIENMNLSESVFSAYKPNKNYPIECEAQILQEDDGGGNNCIEDTFQRAVSPSQCCAALPVQGVLQSNPSNLKFSIMSVQVLITVIFMCSSTILTLCTLKNLLKIGVNAKNFVGLAFFGCVQCSCLLFALLAPRWPKLMRSWYRTEIIFTQKPYAIPKRNLAYRVRLAAGVIIFLSALEHGLYLSSAVLSYRRGKEVCAPILNTTVEISFDDYIVRNYDYVFQILPPNFYVGIGVLVVNGLCTFIWNYMDMFIMMVSKGIAYRFEQITIRINKLANKEVPESVFIEIREHYVKLCELLEMVDENLSGIILLSCINNLYFVCYQLLNVFNKLRWPINYVYFWYSLLYLIGRTAFVFLSAAAINDESKGGLAVLRRVSSKTWCVEIERLIFAMTTQTVALSGKKFYFLTRRLLFGMAGTIVTYELVLLQFDEPNRAKGLPNLCG